MLIASVAAFSVGTTGKAALAQPLVARSVSPVCQFGTGNFDDSQTTGFKFSPIPGESKVREALAGRHHQLSALRQP